MRLSPEGLQFLKRWEGRGGKPVLVAYRDVAGIWTVGYGHTKTATKGQVITSDQAEQLLRGDLAAAEEAVGKLAREVPLTQSQYDALVSFTFNVGSGWLTRSTLARSLRAHDYTDAAQQFLRWKKAGGVVVPGLFNRRVAERALFLQEMPKVD